jgi:hypothetical protein
MDMLTEDALPERRPVRWEERAHDLVVVGGGLAGVCAAIAAARLARTKSVALVQERSVLGGNSSSEIRVAPVGAGHCLPWARETGIVDELMVEERARNHEALFNGSANAVWDLVLYEAIVAEPNLTLYLNTSVRDVVLDSAEPARIAAVEAVQLGNERAYRLAATLFLDATGDGTVGWRAGADAREGRESRAEFGEPLAPDAPDDLLMGSTLLFRARDQGRPVPFKAPAWAHPYPDESRLIGRSHRELRGGYWWIEIQAPFHTVHENEDIRAELTKHLLGIWDHIKNHCVDREQAATWALDWCGWLPGKRESRRLMGDVVLTENDVRAGRRFEDAVCHGGWFLDAHAAEGLLRLEAPASTAVGYPNVLNRLGVPLYSIPLRALYSRNVSNLLMAGRDLSATHMAHSSTRVMLTCAVIGQAAGSMAAHCLTNGIRPGQLHPDHTAAVQQTLLRHDVYVPGVANADPGDLARRARVRASSESVLRLPEAGDDWYACTEPLAMLLPLSAGRLERVSLLLENRASQPLPVRIWLRPAAHVWDAPHCDPLATAEARVAPGTHWIELAPGFDAAPGLYWLGLEPQPELSWRYVKEPPTGVNAMRCPPPTEATAFLADPKFGGRWSTVVSGYRFFGAFAVRLTPESRPYGAANVLSGVTRPERWPNCWISNPAQPVTPERPQWLELSWERPVRLDTVQVTFDTRVRGSSHQRPTLSRVEECVRDYHLEVATGEGWQRVAGETGNYHRRRTLRFAPAETKALRLVVTATNGAPAAQIYEIRAYLGGAG